MSGLVSFILIWSFGSAQFLLTKSTWCLRYDLLPHYLPNPQPFPPWDGTWSKVRLCTSHGAGKTWDSQSALWVWHLLSTWDLLTSLAFASEAWSCVICKLVSVFLQRPQPVGTVPLSWLGLPLFWVWGISHSPSESLHLCHSDLVTEKG